MDLDFKFLDELRGLGDLSNYVQYFLIGCIIFIIINFAILFLMLFHIIDIHTIVEGMKTCVMVVRL